MLSLVVLVVAKELYNMLFVELGSPCQGIDKLSFVVSGVCVVTYWVPEDNLRFVSEYHQL